MKRLITFLVVIGIFVLLGIKLAFVVNNNTSRPIQKVAAFTPTVTAIPHVANPVTLSIPKLSVHSHIEFVGLDTAGRMDVPKGIGDTGWYSLGTTPGEIGNAVIDGHFDTPTGAPSVFYYLSSLVPGDNIQVTDASHKTYTFTVTRVTSFPDQGFPISEVFGSSTSKNLNLITCSGTWDKAAHNYSNRTVIFSTLTSD